jgi:hypothetical protein
MDVQDSLGQFRKAVDASTDVWSLRIVYDEVPLQQTRVTAACNAAHPIEARFCRWLPLGGRRRQR